MDFHDYLHSEFKETIQFRRDLKIQYISTLHQKTAMILVFKLPLSTQSVVRKFLHWMIQLELSSFIQEMEPMNMNQELNI
jgi:hypothetical protein